MKRYMNTILIGSLLLLIFPFLGFPEFWENLYVVIIAFVIGYSLLLLRHRSGLVKHDDEEKTLHDHIKEIKHKFEEHMTNQDKEGRKKLSEISLEDDE